MICMYQVLLLAGWNPELPDDSTRDAFNMRAPAFLAKHVNMHTNHHIQDSQGATPKPTVLLMSSYYLHMCIHLLHKTVQCELTNPAETHEGRNKMIHEAPEVILAPPTSHSLLT